MSLRRDARLNLDAQGRGHRDAPIPKGRLLPADSAAQRLAQMRTLGRDFSASTHDDQDRRWELRVLSQPLYRYESTDPDVVDGAIFAFVTSAGTDPEALLVIEERDDPRAAAACRSGTERASPALPTWN